MKPRIDAVAIISLSFVLLSQPLMYSTVFIRDNQAAVIRMVIGVGKKRDQAPFFSMILQKAMEIHIKNRIGVQKKKIFRQLIPALKQRAGVPQRLFLNIIGNMYSKRPAGSRRYL